MNDEIRPTVVDPFGKASERGRPGLFGRRKVRRLLLFEALHSIRAQVGNVRDGVIRAERIEDQSFPRRDAFAHAVPIDESRPLRRTNLTKGQTDRPRGEETSK